MSIATKLLTDGLKLGENIFYQAIDRFSLSWAVSASTGIDAALMYNQSRHHLADNVQKIRLLSNVLNTGWIVWDAIELYRAFGSKEVVPFDARKSMIGKALILGASISLAYSIYKWISFPITPPQEWLNEVPEEKRGAIALRLTQPEAQVYGQIVYVSRLIMQTATAILSPEKALICGLNAASLALSLIKTVNLQWLKFSFVLNSPRPIILDPTKVNCKQLSFSYNLPLLPSHSSNQCEICYDDNPPASFCPTSPMDMPCLVNYIYTQTLKIKDVSEGSFTREGIKLIAALKISQKLLPQSTIRTYPSSHHLEAEYTSWEHGRFNTSLEIIPDEGASKPISFLTETFWARLDMVYSTFQTGLTAMIERHHNLASKIVLAQAVLIPFDAMMLLQNYYQLYSVFYDKIVLAAVRENTPVGAVNAAQTRYDNARLEESRLRAQITQAMQNGSIIQIGNQTWGTTPATNALISNYNHSLVELTQSVEQQKTAIQAQKKTKHSLENQYRNSLYKKMAVASVAVAALTAFGAIYLSQRFKSAVNLTDLLKKIASPEDVGRIQLTWNMPWIPYLSQCILANRIMVNLSLSLVSPKNKKSYLAAALLQSLGMTKLAQLPWVKMDRAFTNLKVEGLKSVDTSFHFLLPSFTPGTSTCSTMESHFEKGLKSIYNFTTRLMHKREWDLWKITTYKNGSYYDTKYLFKTILSPDAIEACSCNFAPYFNSLRAWAQHVYGRLPIEFTYTN